MVDIRKRWRDGMISLRICQ